MNLRRSDLLFPPFKRSIRCFSASFSGNFCFMALAEFGCVGEDRFLLNFLRPSIYAWAYAPLNANLQADGLTKRPHFSSASKYFFPRTMPLFFPTGLSMIIPNQIPLANSTWPTYATSPQSRSSEYGRSTRLCSNILYSSAAMMAWYSRRSNGAFEPARLHNDEMSWTFLWHLYDQKVAVEISNIYFGVRVVDAILEASFCININRIINITINFHLLYFVPFNI